MANRFRVLHVTDYASSYEGAFIRQLRMLDEELRSRGARPSALALSSTARQQPWAAQLDDEGWDLYVIPGSSTHGSRSAIHGIWTAIESCAPDAVHVHFGTYDLAARAAVRKAPADVRLLWHYRTALEESVDARSMLRRAKDYAKYVRASRDVDLVVGVTQALADEAVARGVDPRRARGIVAGCDTDRFEQSASTRARVRAELGLADDDVMLLHMGWHWYRKGGDLLADALAQVQRSHSDQRVFAYSIGAPEGVELGDVRVLPMTDRVHELHQASDIFISASRSEGFGNGVVEAMACERVVAAASAEGQQETFAGVGGVLEFDVGDAAGLANAVSHLLERRENWGRLGATNRAHVLRNHSMRRWASEMADAYGELVEHGLEQRRAPDAIEGAA